MRQEQLAKLRHLFVSLGGLSTDLENSTNLLNAYAAINIQKARQNMAKTGTHFKVIAKYVINIAGKESYWKTSEKKWCVET